ncbi:alkaline shock response membrane anchor protein AmaP [Streptomyces sp. NEAU-W12]|uniref:alkaline shock response membrane anchor protein AmaP n=1 Tax=Streptomyces sp. NEAU-W12 TaxID=2994668 RepID=UPI00224A7612|nr:alkaline shock response membrane anchor protein AmaP [Streptomyces sp. NEAU-W12]MCX2922790.1 alkaline shock response membrane anchor protein AmaP [Streptomyces sp. NEAU-W12]
MRAVIRIVNRVLLGIVGLLLVALGGAVLAVGLGVPAPSWWLHGGRHDVLLDEAERTRWRDTGWWWPVVIAALAVLVLLLLWWLVAVVRRRRLAEVFVATGDGDEAVLRGRALETALAHEAGRLDGVGQAHVRLTRRRGLPRTRARLLLEPHADPGTVLDGFTTGALTHARESTGLGTFPTEVRLRSVKHRPERVS